MSLAGQGREALMLLREQPVDQAFFDPGTGDEGEEDLVGSLLSYDPVDDHDALQQALDAQVEIEGRCQIDRRQLLDLDDQIALVEGRQEDLADLREEDGRQHEQPAARPSQRIQTKVPSTVSGSTSATVSAARASARKTTSTRITSTTALPTADCIVATARWTRSPRS